jgi:YD repeat-containing protein
VPAGTSINCDRRSASRPACGQAYGRPKRRGTRACPPVWYRDELLRERPELQILQRRTYDALGRLVRVDHPDGTLETVEIGPRQQVARAAKRNCSCAKCRS